MPSRPTPNITSVEDTLFWALLSQDCPFSILTSKGRAGSDEVLRKNWSLRMGGRRAKLTILPPPQAIDPLGSPPSRDPCLVPHSSLPSHLGYSGEARSMGRERRAGGRAAFPCSPVCDIRRALASKVYLDLFPLVVIPTPAITEIHHRLRGQWRVVGVCFSSGVDGKLFILSLFGVMSVQRGPRSPGRGDCVGTGIESRGKDGA